MGSGKVKTNTILAIVNLASPIFIVLVISLPIGALIYAINFGSLTILNYVHVITGAAWTGIDLFMGFVLGPVLSGMEPGDRVGIFKRLMPKMTFLMPVLATVTITTGIELAQQLAIFSLVNPWIVAAVVIVAILTVQGFGILLPNEIRIFRQLLSEVPDIGRISRLGMLNLRLGGVQGILQLAIIFIMANLRF